MRRRVPQLASLDLNLILVLRELLRERNVTRAAQRLGVTQPAASASLSRLRRHFGDELLVREHGEYVLTPLGEQLAQQVDAVCAAAEQLFSTGANFDPSSTRREFTLMMSDYTVAILATRLSRLLAEQAPCASLRIRLVREALAVDLPHRIRWVDGIVAPERRQALPLVHSTELFTDEWVCIMSADNRLAAGGPLTLDDLQDASWVMPFYRNHSSPLAPPATRQLALLGIKPQVTIGVESYLAVPQLVAGSSLVALMQRRLVAQFADRLDLRVCPCPGNPDPIIEALWWHEDRDADPAHVWLREALVALAAKVG